MKTTSNPYRNITRDFHRQAHNAVRCGILLLILAIAVPAFAYMKSTQYHPILLPEIINYEYQPEGLTTIHIDKTGAAWYRWDRLDLLPDPVKFLQEDWQFAQNSVKVVIKADKRVPFGKITAVLDILAKVHVKKVALITGEKAALCDFFKEIAKIWAEKRQH